MERLGRAQEDILDRRRHGHSFVPTRPAIVDGDTVKPILQTFFLVVLYTVLERGVQLQTKSKVKSIKKKPSSAFGKPRFIYRDDNYCKCPDLLKVFIC